MKVIKGEDYLTKQEFANAVSMSYNAVSNWISKGWFKPAYVSERGRQFFTQSQVDAYWRGEYAPVEKIRG